jgi:hypothetical protein
VSQPVHDPEAVDRHRADEAKPIGDEVDATPAGESRPCPVPVCPGYGQAAYRAGCEDEWIDRMAAKYGGEW